MILVRWISAKRGNLALQEWYANRHQIAEAGRSKVDGRLGETMFQRVHFRRFLQSSITISGLWPYMHDYKLYWGLKMYECKKKRREYILYVWVCLTKENVVQWVAMSKTFVYPPSHPLNSVWPTPKVWPPLPLSLCLWQPAALLYTLFKSSCCYKSAGIVTRGSTFYAQKCSPLSQVVCSMFC